MIYDVPAGVMIQTRYVKVDGPASIDGRLFTAEELAAFLAAGHLVKPTAPKKAGKAKE